MEFPFQEFTTPIRLFLGGITWWSNVVTNRFGVAARGQAGPARG